MKKISLHSMVLFAGIVVLFSACSKKSNVLNGGNNYTVSGRVLESSAGLSGVSVHLTSEGKDIIALTDSSGFYSFSNIPDGAYTITPSKNNYSMNPANMTVTVADSNVVVPVFVAVKTFYSVSGRVIESSTGLPGVSIHFTGAGKDTTAVTSSTGSFIFTGLLSGTFTITWSKTDYTFTPAGLQFTLTNEDYSLSDITATKVTEPPPLGVIFNTLPGGTFQMGDTWGQGSSNEKPVHMVTVSSFKMCNLEIKNRQYCAWLNAALIYGDISANSSTVTGKKGVYSGQTYISLSDSIDSYNQCWIRYSNNTFSVVLGYEDWPVVSVTWFGSKAFAEYYGWDLPREAEWEYACRSGQSYKYGTNDGKISSFQANYDYYGSVGPYHPVIVGSYRSNSFGLGDMSGNVWEWCSDWYGVYDTLAATDPTGPQSGALKVIRGGGWYGTDWVCRSTYRSPYTPGIGSLMIGFRVVSRQL